MTLQVIMLQYAHQYGPVIRLIKAYCSYSTCEYQAIKKFSNVSNAHNRPRYNDNNIHRFYVFFGNVVL